jgi:hypothetical protein
MLGLAGSAALALAPQALLIGRALYRWLRHGAALVDPSPHLLGWWTAAIAFAGGALALIAIGWLARRGRRRSGGAGVPVGPALVACLLLGLVAERAAFERAGTYLGTGLGTWADSVPPTPAQDFIAAQPGAGRVLSVVEHANRALSAGLAAVDGYETIYPLRYHELFGALIAPQRESSRAIATYFDRWGNRAYAFSTDVSKPIADLLGVRWLYVAPEARVDRALRSLYPPAAPVGPGWLERFRGGDRVVYENGDAFPRAFVVHATVEARDLEAVRMAMLDASSTDLRSTAFLEAGIGSGLVLEQPTDSSADIAELVVDTPDRVEIRARTSTSGLLILADTFARGWTAQVDRRDADILPVDLGLRGVALPAGDHEVTFVYRPVETLAGVGVSLVVLLGLAGWLVAAGRPTREPPRER